MKRRTILAAMVSCGASAPAMVAGRDARSETDADDIHRVEWLMRELAGIEPRPGEAERIREALLGDRTSIESDPRVQPSISFDPDVRP